MKHYTIALLTSVAILTGCQTTGQKEGIGTVIGGAIGAVTGAQFGSGKGQLAMVAVGTLLGAGLGNSIGSSLDDVDKMKMQQTNTGTLEFGRSNVTKSWYNPDTRHGGSITPVNTYSNKRGEDCREFHETITIDDVTEVGYGTACRDSAGRWIIQ